MLVTGNDTQFGIFCHASGRDGIDRNSRFSSNAARVEHHPALLDLVKPLMQQRTIDQCSSLAKQASFPCSPINTIDLVFTDPQVQARDMRIGTAWHQTHLARCITLPVLCA